LLRVTEDELICERERRFDNPSRYVLHRQEIRQVRRERGPAPKWAGAGIGAAVGAGIVAAAGSTDSETRAVGPIVGALGGGLVGWIAGSIISDRGRVVYER